MAFRSRFAVTRLALERSLFLSGRDSGGLLRMRVPTGLGHLARGCLFRALVKFGAFAHVGCSVSRGNTTAFCVRP